MTKNNSSSRSRLRETEINPVAVIVVAAVVVLSLGYFFWIRPMMHENKIRAEWATPEKAALRGPGRPVDQKHEDFVAKLRASEGQSGTKQPSRKDERN